MPPMSNRVNMLLFYVTGGKQKDKVLFDFQETKSPFQKMFILSVVDVARSTTYTKLAQLDFINKKIIELIFKLNIPLCYKCLISRN